MGALRRLTRDKLLDVGSELFAQKGYDGTSITDITHALRITRPTLYTHAKSKADLLEAIHERLIAFYEQTARTYIRKGDSPVERIEGAIRLHLEATRCFPFSLRMALNSVRDTSISHDKKLDDWWHQQDLVMQRAIEEGQALGQITREISAKILKHMFWGVINEIPYWYRPFGPLPAEEVNAQILSFLAGTVGPASKGGNGKRRASAPAAPLETARSWRFQIVARAPVSVTTRAQIPADSNIQGSHQMTAAITALLVWTCESFFRDDTAAASGQWHLRDLTVRLFPPVNGAKLRCVAARSLSAKQVDVWDVSITRDGSDKPLCITRALFMRSPA